VCRTCFGRSRFSCIELNGVASDTTFATTLAMLCRLPAKSFSIAAAIFGFWVCCLVLVVLAFVEK
jgi:hypothetical protein